MSGVCSHRASSEKSCGPCVCASEVQAEQVAGDPGEGLGDARTVEVGPGATTEPLSAQTGEYSHEGEVWSA